MLKKRLFLTVFIGLNLNAFAQHKNSKSKADYFPPAGTWAHQTPQQLGLNADSLRSAIDFAIQNEAKEPRNMEISQALSFGKEPFGEGIGPFAERGDPTGIIIYKGYIVAEWGDPYRVDMTHSVTKSFLSTVIGLAVEKGLIKSVQDSVYKYVPPIEVYNPTQINRSAEDLGKPQMLYPFASPHNKKLTWDVMLRQTSDWEGTLWGKPDWADRPQGNASEWINRKRNEPGTVWKYNDTRVNALALAATNVWRQPLPKVLKEYLMDPIGASNTWRWYGYRNSWIVLDGQAVQSVSGGGHFGGGMFINAYDMARFGLLTLNRGNWNGKQLIAESWVKQALTPTTANTGYGYMNWFLNTNQKMLPHAPATAFIHLGNGNNMIYVDPEHDLVMVVRWIQTKGMDGTVAKVLAAFSR
ncbi:MAG: serine hydrolase domain-containing protein [Janthinobacterium lividum]